MDKGSPLGQHSSSLARPLRSAILWLLLYVNGKCSPQLTNVNAVLDYLRNFRTWSLTRDLVALEVGLERSPGPPPCPLCFRFLQDVIKSEVLDAHSCGHAFPSMTGCVTLLSQCKPFLPKVTVVTATRKSTNTSYTLEEIQESPQVTEAQERLE